VTTPTADEAQRRAEDGDLRRVPRAPRPRTGYDTWRWCLAGGYAVLVVVALVVGARPASWAEVRTAVSSGAVADVRVASAPDDGSLLRSQQVTWREGLVQRRAEVTVVPPTATVDWVSTPPTTISRDAGEELRALAPGLRVERTSGTFDGSASFWGRVMPLPAAVTAALLLGWACWLGLLVHGPAPWRATRWAWFWLSWVPGGVLAFFLLAGPTPGVPAPRRPARRLTGGWALLLSFVLAPVVGSLLGLPA
jgi:hypothetical protein